ncbi:MAG: DUF5698 domain-containing protein [Acholeplasmataceae bacterium]
MIYSAVIDFFTAVPFWELVFIFFAKIIEVTIGTMRVILITKGFRRPGTILAFFEIMLWVFVASSVLSTITEMPIKGIVYSAGFVAGIYIGSLLESHLAVGKMEIRAIASLPSSVLIISALREAGYGLTSVDAHGKDDVRVLIIIFANRKNKDKVIKIIKSADDKALVVAQEISLIQNGYVIPWRRIGK